MPPNENLALQWKAWITKASSKLRHRILSGTKPREFEKYTLSNFPLGYLWGWIEILNFESIWCAYLLKKSNITLEVPVKTLIPNRSFWG